MKKMVIYDPAMCCETGVCGPNVDKNLMRVATLIHRLKKNNVIIERHNLATDPGSYVTDRTINALLMEHGPEILPVTVVDGEVVRTGEYLSNNEFIELLEVPREYLKTRLNDAPGIQVKDHV